MAGESDSKSNALRLLAENWKTPRALAEQIYILETEQPDAGVSALSAEAQARRDEAAQANAPPLPPPPSDDSTPARFIPFPPAAAAVKQLAQAVHATFSSPQFTQANRQSQRREAEQSAPTNSQNETAAPGRRDDAEPAFSQNRRLPAPSQPGLPSTRTRQQPQDVQSISRQPRIDDVPARRPVESPPALGAPAARSDLVAEAAKRIFTPPEILKPYSLELPPTDFSSPMPLGGGTSTTQGYTVGASVSPLTVQLYSQGSLLAPDDTPPVLVNIAQIDPSDVVPDKTWITGIYLDGNGKYEAQIPIWM